MVVSGFLGRDIHGFILTMSVKTGVSIYICISDSTAVFF